MYTWLGYKTEPGTTPDHIQSMNESPTTCRHCGSTRLKTELDTNSPVGRAQQKITLYFAEFLYGPLPTSPCHQAEFLLETVENILVGRCLVCRKDVCRQNPRTQFGEWLDGEPFNTLRDDLRRMFKV